MKRMRYQEGTLRLEVRANGTRVWEYRWYETQIDGSRRRRSAMIGTIDEFPNESVAQKAIAALRANINSETPRGQLDAVSFGTLIQHYRERNSARVPVRLKTINVAEGYVSRWITLRWLSYRLKDIKAVVGRGVVAVASPCEWQPGQDSEPHARHVQSRDPLA